MTHPIVVAVSEEDEAQAAIALGLMAARLLGAPLVLAGIVVAAAPGGATVLPGWSPAADPTLLRDYTARRLHRLADEVPDDVPCTIRIEAATSVHAGLELAVAAEEAQLLVIGASHLGPLARAARGDVGAEAIRQAGCAVLVAPEGPEHPLDAAPRRVVVGVDGSPEGDGALGLATYLAARAGADLEVLQTVEAATLVDASTGCDLLVLGGERTAGVASLWSKAVSTTVLHHARCPVLVVPQRARVPAPA
jgi:nucleotide-binding universal stress UspA family protein